MSLDSLPGEEAEELKVWLEPILDAVDADIAEQALADLATLKQLIHSRQPEEQPILEQ